MTKDEFQKMILEKLQNLEKGQSSLEAGMNEINKSLVSVTEQTADLSEFREEANSKLDTLIVYSKSVAESALSQTKKSK